MKWKWINKSLFSTKEKKEKRIRNKNMHLIDTFTQGCGKIIPFEWEIITNLAWLG